MNYKISIIGCDDTTEFLMELDDREYVFLVGLAKKSVEVSEYGRQPTIRIEKATNET